MNEKFHLFTLKIYPASKVIVRDTDRPVHWKQRGFKSSEHLRIQEHSQDRWSHTFSREWTCCFCRSSRAWHWVSRDSLSSSILTTLSFSRLRSLSRSLMAASWVIWVACRLLIWPTTGPNQEAHVRHRLNCCPAQNSTKNKRKFDRRLSFSQSNISLFSYLLFCPDLSNFFSTRLLPVLY